MWANASYLKLTRPCPILSGNSCKSSTDPRKIYSKGAGSQLPVFNHYENTPIQIYRKFHLQKLNFFKVKKTDIFHISAQNIDYGYSLEPPRRGGSNEYP